MASKSYNDIRSIAEDWQYDDRNGLKYSGKSVQKFIKWQLQEKVAATYFDAVELRLYGFRSTEDRDKYVETKDTSLIIDSCPFNFTGMQYRVVIDNLMGSTQLYFTTNQSTAIINVGFISQEKGITDFEWKDKTEDFLVSVAVDKGAQGNYVNIKTDETVLNGSTLSFDVKNLIISGANRVKITATGKDTGATTTLVYTVTLTAMYIAPSNFTWYKPFIEGEKFSVGGLNIGGTLSKELVIKVTAENYAPEPIRVPLGTNTYTDLAYYYDGLPFPSNGTGVYNLEIWVDAGGVQTEHLNYNIICVSQADKDKAQLVCIGTIEKSIVNYSDNKYFEYCVYNGGAASGEPTISLDATVNSNSTNIMTETLSVATSTAIAFERSLEIEAEEAQLKLVATMTYGNTQRVVFAVDNSKSYPATSGAVFYLNPSTRSNAQANRETIINAANDTAISAVWTKMAWSDLADGYTVDEENRKCLKLPAGSKVVIDYKPLKAMGSGKTIEFVYKVQNASDYNEPIISICEDDNATNPNFKGIVIRPKNILLHSRNLNVQDNLQDYNTSDEELMIVTITIAPNYKTNYGNLAQIYVNGDKKRSFEFNEDSWVITTDGNIVLGSSSADLILYKMRVYERGFEKVDAMRNYRSSLPDTQAKEEFTAWNEACIDDNYNLDYETCEKNGLNTMVIELLNGGVLPNLLNQKKAQCNLHLNIRSDISMLDEELQRLLRRGDINKITEWIINQTIEGQGSTATGYYRWNFRWKLDEDYGKRRITAKKNVASSMHSHKMGATRLFNYLHQECVGANDANADVAVTQFPVFGFLRIPIEGTSQYVYQPIGLYTIGADKGDKHTFGYDNKEFKNTLIHLEGADHTPKGVGYDYPWGAMAYSGEKEALGPKTADNSIEKAFECGACGTYSPDDAADDENIYTMLGREFRPAYDVAYFNNPFIHGVPQSLADMNANVVEWRKQSYNGKSYENLEFYTHGIYDLYYYDIKERIYKSTGVNVVRDLGLNTEGLTEEQIEAEVIRLRKARFAEQWSNYWDTKDAIFTFCFILLIAATDNFKKNLYPYKFKSLADGGKWCHRNDDLDTIFDINNQGRSGKRYSVLVGDTTETGNVFRGDNSVFWTLIKETQQDAIKKMMGDIFKAMTRKAIAVGYSGTARQQLVGCIRHFFWDNAQEYFAPSAYNADAEWTYEDAWAIKQGSVAPLTQALGSHYEAEKDFVSMRMLFLASYYNFAPFNTEADEDISEGQLKYRGSTSHTYRITTAADFRPMVITGESSMTSADGRVESGQTVDIIVAGTDGDDTTISIQGLDWIADLGDMSTLVVSSDDSSLTIQSKRLNRIKIGDKDRDKVTCNIKTLNIGSCPSMTIVDAQNLGSLTGTIDLASLPRLREAYFGGTDVRGIKIPKGAKIEKLQIPVNISSIDFRDLKYLQDFNYENLSFVEDLRIEGCDSLNAFNLLSGAYNAEKSSLKNIRITDFTADGNATDMDMLANLVNDKDKDGNDHQYNGIGADGKVITYSNPVIDGTFNAVTPLYEDSLDVVTTNYPNLVINESGVYYQRFKDKEVLRVLLANNLGDGLGVVKENWANVTSVGQWFREDTNLVSFLELALSKVRTLAGFSFYNCANLREIDLKNITTVGNSDFFGCSSLLEVDLSNVSKLSYRSFYQCTALKKVVLGEELKEVTQGAFGECTSLEEINLDNVISITDSAFYKTAVKELDISKATYLGYYVFFGCESLINVNISNVEHIDSNTFDACRSLTGNFDLPHLSYLGNYAFRNTKIESVIAPALNSIGNQALSNCTSLTSANIPNVETIGANAFDGCTSLEGDLELPRLTSLDSYAFRGTKITSADMPLLESLGGAAFNSIRTLKTVSIPKVKTILSNTFNSCTALASVKMPNIETIRENAFDNCTSLTGDFNLQNLRGYLGALAFRNTKIDSFIAPNIKSVEYGTFLNCVNLTSIDVEGVENIGDAAFNGCASLSGELHFPNLGALGSTAFYSCKISSFDAPLLSSVLNDCFNSCKDLKTVILESVTILEARAFVYCTSLTSVDIPLVETIGTSAFQDCTSLTRDLNFPQLTSLGESAFRNAGITSFAAPQITEVYNSAFRFCTKLKTFDATNVTLIDAYAFDGCTSLTTININNVQTIEAAAFNECSSLSGDFNFAELETVGTLAFCNTRITSFIALKVKTFGYGVFYNCAQLKRVELRDVESFDTQVFQSCSAMETLIIKNPTPPSLGAGVFADAGKVTIYVPDTAIDTYKNATGWSTYASKIKGISELPTE